MKQILKNKNSLKIILIPICLVVLFIVFISIIKNLTSKVSLRLSPAPITSQYLYQNKSKDFAVYLGSRTEKQIPEVKFAVESSSIDFSPEDSISSQVKLTKQDEKSIIYKDVYPGIDLSYSLTDKGVKEEIIIDNQQSVINNPQFTFKLNLKNAVPQEDLMDNSAIIFVDSVSGNYLFHFTKPFMIDAGGNRSEQVKMTLNPPSSAGSPYSLSLIPNPTWLKSAIFPVVIDPTIVLDNADTVANWTSSNSTRFTPSQDTTDKQEGTGSVQVIASSVTDDLYYFLKNLGIGNTSIATKYATIDLEMDVKSGNQTISTDTSWGNATADTRMLGVRVDGNLTIDATKTLTAAARKRGMVIYVTGDATINGTLSMTAKGANAAGQRVLILNKGTEYEVAAAGGVGGTGNTSNGVAPGSGTGNACGGGSAGYGNDYAPGNGGNGSAGTSYSGGTGGGGNANTGSAGAGASNGGTGGYGVANPTGWGAGGGAGNPGGAGQTGWAGSQGDPGENGTGGLLILFVKGTLTFGANGLIESKGKNGGNYGGSGYGGGASGGGSVNLFYTAASGYSASKLNVNGGLSMARSGGIGSTNPVQTDIGGGALNSTLTRDLGAGGTKDLSGHSSVTFWIKSTRTGTYLQFGMGESAWNDNTTSITINSANTWEQKTWDISGISDANKNAIRYLGFKVTNADTDFTMKFDDIKSPNSSPTAPTSLLTNGQTNPTNLSVGATSPYFSAIYNDSDVGDTANAYRIQVDDDSGFGSTLWDSGASGTAMSNCNKEARCSNITYGGSSLTEATTYYWRIKFWDIESAEGAWSTGTNTFSVNYAPTAPTSLLSEGQTNPSGVTDTTPEFSAIYNDLGIGDTANKYQIQVDDDSGFGSTLWDSGASGTAMNNCIQGNRCSDISYGGASTDLQYGQKYYWRIKFWDDSGFEGAWNTESAYFTMSDIYSSTACMIDDSSHPGSTIVKWSDNSTLETGYQIDRSVDGGAFSLLTTQPANTISYTDSTTSTSHIYQYRVTATSSNGNSIICQTLQVNYGRGTFYFK